MNTLSSRFRALLAVSSLLLGTGSTLFAAGLTLQKVPPLTVEQAPAYPENLARQHLGARVESAGTPADLQIANVALLSGDPTATYALPAGKTTLLVALPKIENVDTISFANQGAKGSVTVATANAKMADDSPQWHSIASQDLASEGLQLKVGPGEAKYVRLSFDVTEPGQIAGFGIYANPQVSDFTAPRTGKKATDKSSTFGLVSYTDMHAKARALYVSSGADAGQANKMIDDQTATSYTFAAEDGTPTTVIDLGKPVSVRRLSAVYAPRAGNMEFYVLQTLPTPSRMEAGPDVSGEPIPTPENVPATMTLSDATLAGLKAVGSVADDGSRGSAAVEFPATSGRYVMVRWLPAAQQDASFALAEIAAFGGASNNTLLVANVETSSVADRAVETEYQDRGDGKSMVDGKTMLDAKDMPGEGPEEVPPGEGPPPTLPQPPPFTFVPVLVPASP